MTRPARLQLVESPATPGLLDSIRDPADLRGLPVSALRPLAEEIRSVLVSTVTRTGGHLGPNLGAVELTIALHRVFDSPRDAIVWDTGHQAYVHKLLTGRRERFATLRAAGGLSGYPSRAESPHDLVENSHASTALGYADGLAKARALRGESDRTVVAVVGDGALTGGMCWEALNNIGGAPGRPVVVVLNDNARSYSPTVGALAGELARLRRAGRPAPTLFDTLGFDYFGPVDGHDTVAVERALRRARALRRPAVVHCVTTKGEGYPPAKADQVDHHHTVPPAGPRGIGPTWTATFGEELAAIAGKRPEVVAVTAAMPHPTGLTTMMRQQPNRVFDVGIAEQHAVTSAAGMAMAGLHPVVCVYATFLNRAFDQTLMDVALHRLPVTFVLDRAGITGPDGPSHHGMWDLSLLGLVPGMRVAAPRDATRLRALLREALDESGPTAVRFPKGRPGAELPARGRIGHGDVLLRHGRGGTLLVGAGACASAAVDAGARLAAQDLPVTVVDPRWLLPPDPDLVDAAAAYDTVVTVEDNADPGGFGDALARALRGADVPTRVRTLGLGAHFLPHDERAALLAALGLTAEHIVQVAVAEAVRGPVRTRTPRHRASRSG